MNLHISARQLPYLQITLAMKSFTPGDSLHLARWRPGRYEAANYTKFIRNVSCATSEGTIIPLVKQNFYTWRPELTESADLIFTYEYYANQLDAGSTYADEDICYLNFLNFLLVVKSRIEENIQITIDLPSHFTTGTSLTLTGKNQWEASGFYELADSPLLSSSTLHAASYTVEDVPFTIWLHNLDPNQAPNLLSDFEKFTRHQVRELGGFPVSEYHFLIITYPTRLYHGVEHGKSTVICLGPSDNVFSDRYDDLLGISSHELFHAWNIIHVRPQEFVAYDFTEIVSIDTGFVAEGFTTYLGDLFLVQSGVRDVDWYLKELGILLRRHFENYGRLETSLIDSSRDLWADGYQLAGPDRKGSIYVEGAVFALIIDLTLRFNSDSSHSLLDVVREMVKRYAENGYTTADIERLVNEYEDVSELFKMYLHTPGDTRPIVEELLNNIGLSLTESPNPIDLERRFGIRILDSSGTWKVAKVHPEAGVAVRPGDIVLEINGKPVDAPDTKIPDGEGRITIERKGIKKELTLSDSNAEFFPVYNVVQVKESSVLSSWLNQSV